MAVEALRRVICGESYVPFNMKANSLVNIVDFPRKGQCLFALLYQNLENVAPSLRGPLSESRLRHAAQHDLRDHQRNSAFTKDGLNFKKLHSYLRHDFLSNKVIYSSTKSS